MNPNSDHHIHLLRDLLCGYRYGSVALQHWHWEVTGLTAQQDHLLLNTVYQLLDGFVDGVGERIIGLGGKTPTGREQGEVTVHLSKENGEVNSMWMAYRLVTALTNKTNTVTSQISDEGTKNLLAGYADQLEQQTYFLRQRAMP